MSRNQKCAPYLHPLFALQMKDHGISMDDHELGISAESERLCQQLLSEPQETPSHTLFSNDALFEKTCKRLKGETETKILRDIGQLIVPSAEILADKGANHLAGLRETTDECWARAMPFFNPESSNLGSDASIYSGPRPQPDFGLGFDRSAFSLEQLQHLEPPIGGPDNIPTGDSVFAATYQMHSPFLTSEVNCGNGGLDVADRQNAYTHAIILGDLCTLFRFVGRLEELDREIATFSISHDDEQVRIWGHYVAIEGINIKFHRHLISKFIFAPSGEGDQRWKAYKFVRNVYDLWLPKHFERICSAIDMLTFDLSPEGSERDVSPSPVGRIQ
jgi:hypothetical protein